MITKQRRGALIPTQRLRATLALTLLFVSPAAVCADDVERGRYLVEALMACDNCHTPRGPAGYDETRRLSGGEQIFRGAGYETRGGDVTPDMESGVGAWSDGELLAAIRNGVGKSGALSPFMPSESYRALTDRDAAAVVAFLRLIAPIRAPESALEMASRLRPDEPPRPPLPGAAAAFVESALAEKKTRGLYVAALARCMACHSGETNGLPDHANRLGAGGKTFRTPSGVAVASNISGHSEKGVGAWSDDELKRAITQGTSRDGAPLKPTMATLSKRHFSKMSREDLDALVAWLRSVPPQE
jgi:mono/diheme cytochrome c family protein